MKDPHCHSSSILVERPAQVAFEIMSDGLLQGQWAWGSANRSEVEPGLFKGTSFAVIVIKPNSLSAGLLLTGSTTVKVAPSPGRLVTRISPSWLLMIP